MKAQITFALPEERQEFEEASRAGEAFGVLSDLDQALRQVVRYGACAELGGLKPDQAEKVREWLWDELRDRGITHLFL